MQEFRVTIEGETLTLPSPFMVIATQNPIEMEGTFEIPEAQRDRFQFKLIMETPSRENERKVLDRFDTDATLDAESIDAVLSAREVGELREQVRAVHVASPVKEYILDIVTSVRENENVEVGASPRAALTLLNTAKARAAIHDREYVIPDDVKSLALPALRHRLVLSTEADLGGITADDVVEGVLASVAPPDIEQTDTEMEVGD
jgi:MoxR-like ATPase